MRDVCEVGSGFCGPLCVLHVGVMVEDALEMLSSNGHPRTHTNVKCVLDLLCCKKHITHCRAQLAKWLSTLIVLNASVAELISMTDSKSLCLAVIV